MVIRWTAALLLSAGWTQMLPAEDDLSKRPVPKNRAEMTAALEWLKGVEPWVPLPKVTEAELAKSDRHHMHSALMRLRYLSPLMQGPLLVTGREEGMAIDPQTVSDVFWITCRVNNCYYCLGHTEAGTIPPAKSVKLTEVEGRARNKHYLDLDGDWSDQPEVRRAMYRFAAKTAFEPHQLTTEDVTVLRSHFNDREIVHLMMIVSGQNAMNRWVHALGLPQESHREYPAPDADAANRGGILREAAAKNAETGESRRGPLESREQVEKALAECRTRVPTVPLIDVKTTEGLLGRRNMPKAPLNETTRLLANWPTVGLDRWAFMRAAETSVEIDPALQAAIAWTVARQDRAWYALGQARAKLKALGWSDDRIFGLDGSIESLPPAEGVVCSLARTMALSPSSPTKADVDAIRKHFSDKQTVEIITHSALAAFTDRLTEVAKLPLEQ